MGLLKGQDDIMNDGDCLQILNTIFAKQFAECVNYIDKWRGQKIISYDGYYNGASYRSLDRKSVV